MPCQVLRIDAIHPDEDTIAQTARALQSGLLVAFPTETVYGLGANALNASAVARIFAAKGRPATNPIIVHVADMDAAMKLALAWPATAQKLAERFWPGPLTLVVQKHPSVSDIVTAGGPTVALRVPAHPVAHALLRWCQLPLAAPSANASTELSPTLAEHVQRSLGDKIDVLLDAGPTSGGLESTVLDVNCTPPRILRPGLVTRAQIEEVIGPIEVHSSDADEVARSPGQMPKHYAPRTPLDVIANSRQHVEACTQSGLGVGWLTHRIEESSSAVLTITLPDDPVSYSAQLYAALHRLDAAGLDRIIVEEPPDGDAWLAVHDRLRRASRES